jgi:uncharacterized protein YegL
MTDLEQTPFDAAEFAMNPEPRCPCLLLLDTSGSMQGAPIAELNAGLVTLKDELMADALAAKRVEVGIVTFGPVTVASPFQTVDSFSPPRLSASGNTPMAGAIQRGLELLIDRKEDYRANVIPYYRPWVFLITDGAPTDDWSRVPELVREGEARNAYAFFAVGVAGANMEILSRIAVREPLLLAGLRFRDLFAWLSTSLKGVSQSHVGTKVPLAPAGWAEV